MCLSAVIIARHQLFLKHSFPAIHLLFTHLTPTQLASRPVRTTSTVVWLYDIAERPR